MNQRKTARKRSGRRLNREPGRNAAKPLDLGGGISKDYLFPTFYGDVTCAMAVFPCSYAKAEAMMLHPKIKPVRFSKGRALVAFSCYIYRNVLGVAPYNEIAMTIPVMVDPGFNVPVLPMLISGFSKFGYYVFSMPVTSRENMLRGHRIWGLPKVTQKIDIETVGDFCITTAYEESGEKYFELRVPTEGKPTKFDVCSNLYSRFEDRLLQSRTCFAGTFNMTKCMGTLFNKNLKPETPYLDLGNSPSGSLLQNLEMDAQPVQLRFAKTMNACFDLHNPDYKPPFEFNGENSK